MMIRDHGLDLHVAGQEDTAIVMLRRAVSAMPDDHRARALLAGMLLYKGQIDEAKAIIDDVLARDRLDVHAWNLLGTYYNFIGEPEKAISCLESGITVMPQHGPNRFDYACTLLCAGKYLQGFEHYEARHTLKAPRWYQVPEWTGKAAKHLYVWAEQGAGDTIAFARFVKAAAQRCERVTFSGFGSLYSLLEGYNALGNVTVTDNTAMALDCDAHVSLMSLPRIFKTTIESIPDDPGLLTTAGMAGGLPDNGRRKVGICWAGTASHVKDKIRSMPFRTMLRLAANHDLDVYSLQTGPRAVDIAEARAQRIVTDLSGHIEGDWSATAAMIRQLDLVVTVDTGVAHLAGALGKPVWICVYAGPYWMWGARGHRTPWYPSARLFRQSKPCDWNGVIDDIGNALASAPAAAQAAA